MAGLSLNVAVFASKFFQHPAATSSTQGICWRKHRVVFSAWQFLPKGTFCPSFFDAVHKETIRGTQSAFRTQLIILTRIEESRLSQKLLRTQRNFASTLSIGSLKVSGALMNIAFVNASPDRRGQGTGSRCGVLLCEDASPDYAC